jgi:hypothetical protein
MKRLRVSLRLLLLVVALAAVFFAWIGARRELQLTKARGRIEELQLMREYAVTRLSSHPQEASTWRTSIDQIDGELKERRRQLASPSLAE